MDNGEAKELRMTVVLEGNDTLDNQRMRQALADSVDRVCSRSGVKVVDVTFMPTGTEYPGTYETEADWLVD